MDDELPYFGLLFFAFAIFLVFVASCIQSCTEMNTAEVAIEAGMTQTVVDGKVVWVLPGSTTAAEKPAEKPAD